MKPVRMTRSGDSNLTRVEEWPGALNFSPPNGATACGHWVVVAGTAKVTIDGKTQLVTENQSVYIPIGAVHSLENPGKMDLHLIEVQSGAYLGEDDIVRFQDNYGRA